MSSFLESRYGIDLRSLAAFRIVLAACALGDLCRRASDLTAHYTDSGILRRSDLFVLPDIGPDWPLALGVAGGTWWSQALLFALAASAALALLLGYRARVASFLLWLLITAIQFRQPFILGTGDGLLRWFLLWGSLLPIGEAVSVDAALAASRAAPSAAPRRVSVSALALWVQIATIFLFVAASMWSDPSWRSGFGLAELLDQDLLVTRIGDRLRHFESLTRLLSLGLPFLLVAGIAACLTPVAAGIIRTVAIAVLAVVLLATAIFLHLAMPAFLLGAALLTFLPSEFWERIARRPRGEPLRLLIPAECDACARLARLTIAAAGLRGHVDVTAMSTAKTPHEHLWQVASGAAENEVGLDALRVLVAASPRFSWKARLLGSAIVQRAAIQAWPILHDNAPTAPRRQATPSRFGAIARPVLAWLLLIVATWVTARPTTPGTNFDPILRTIGLPAAWTVRTLERSHTGWFSTPGVLANGREVELLGAGGPLPTIEEAEMANRSLLRRPANVSATLRNERWRRFFAHSVDASTHEQFLFYGRYLCREWNRQHGNDEQLRRFSFVMMRRAVQHEARVYTTDDYERNDLWNHDCFG